MNSTLFLTINSWAGNNTILDSIMIFSSQYLIYIPFAIVASCIGYLVYKRQWREVLFFTVSLIVAFVILFVLSKLYISDRPFVHHTVTQLIAHAANQSFPSDHTTGAMTVALALLAFTRFKKIGWLLVLVASLIGFSRIFVGVHYPLDVAGGVVTAILGVSITFLIRKLFPNKQSVQFEPESTTL
jgi:undecaprenyl-diphosphatase